MRLELLNRPSDQVLPMPSVFLVRFVQNQSKRIPYLKRYSTGYLRVYLGDVASMPISRQQTSLRTTNVVFGIQPLTRIPTTSERLALRVAIINLQALGFALLPVRMIVRLRMGSYALPTPVELPILGLAVLAEIRDILDSPSFCACLIHATILHKTHRQSSKNHNRNQRENYDYEAHALQASDIVNESLDLHRPRPTKVGSLQPLKV